MRVSILALVVTLSVFIAPLVAFSMPTINCHCFRDRSFDAQRPQAADPYFLATAQNSFFAARFGLSKKTVVMKKQKGAAADELWLAYWLAEKSETVAEKLLSRRGNGEGWLSIVEQLGLDEARLGKQFMDVLQQSVETTIPSTASDVVTFHLDQLIVDQILVEQALYDAEELTRLRRGGATNKMVLLLLALSDQRPDSAEQLYAQVVSDGRSWGELIDRYAIDVKQFQPQFKRLLAK